MADGGRSGRRHAARLPDRAAPLLWDIPVTRAWHRRAPGTAIGVLSSGSLKRLSMLPPATRFGVTAAEKPIPPIPAPSVANLPRRLEHAAGGNAVAQLDSRPEDRDDGEPADLSASRATLAARRGYPVGAAP
jgi:hypothetical protein